MAFGNIFYVYVYMDPRKSGKFVYGDLEFDFEPFYVGKGKGRQYSSHLVKRRFKNSYKFNKIRKILSLGLKPIIIKYEEGLSENEAFDLEKKLIKTIGRYNLGPRCPLTNKTDGGEGSCGLSPWNRGLTKEIDSRVGKGGGWCKGRTKENDPSLASMSRKKTGRTKETDPGLARMARKKTGRTKETDIGVASQAKKLTGRTKEDTPYLAKMAKKLIGRTKETHLHISRHAENRRGRTKETYPHIARQAEKMKGEHNPMKRPEVIEKKSKKWNLIFPDGTNRVIKNLAKFCRETGLRKGRDFKIDIKNLR